MFVVLNSSARKWTFRYTMPTSGRRSEIVIGDYPGIDFPAAEKRALELKSLVKKGVDPSERQRDEKQAKAREQRKRSSTVPPKFRFWDLFGEWLDYMSPKVSESTVDFYRTVGNAHILPGLGGLDVRSIGFIDCEELILSKKELGVSVPSRIHRTLRAFLGYCLERGFVASNPLAGRKELAKSVAVDPRSRFLSPREIHKFMNELGEQQIPRKFKRC